MKSLLNALKELNIKGKVTVKKVASDRLAVYVNGVYFGLWDVDRKTFVD